MNLTDPRGAAPSAAAPRYAVGRVTSVSGAQASVTLNPAPPQSPDGEQATVGKFVGIVSGGAIIIGVVSEINEFPGQDGDRMRRSVARLELLGEISTRDGNAARFKRGLDSYPKIGDSAILMTEAELRIVYGTVDNDRAHVGDLQQNTNIGVHINIDELVSRHFAVIGTTGVGKSSGVVILLQKILSTRPNLRIFLVDPHNEFGKCFGDKARGAFPA